MAIPHPSFFFGTFFSRLNGYELTWTTGSGLKKHSIGKWSAFFLLLAQMNRVFLSFCS